MIADPYPKDLAEVDEAELGFAPNTADPLVRAVHRLAQALEQNTLALLDRGSVAAPPALAALPPVQRIQTNGVCPIHNAPWKTVPAGVSKKTGKAYEAFQACSIAGCDQRPPR